MLEYFAYKKFKKHQGEKEAKGEATDAAKEEAKLATKLATEQRAKGRSNNNTKKEDKKHGSSPDRHVAKAVLKPEDETFLQKLLADEEEEDDDDGPPPPLPPRVYEWEQDWPSDTDAVSSDGSRRGEEASKVPEQTADKTEDKAEKKPPSRLSLLFTKQKKQNDGLKPDGTVTPKEAERETKDLSRVLDRLNLSAKNNKVVSQSKESSELLQKFTQVFKDLVNGVPTAYDDLTRLIEDRDGTISKLFDKLPSSLQKLVTQLPEKLTGSLAPEVMAAAAAAAEGQGVKGGMKKMFLPQNLAELVTKPGAIVGMLKAIVEVLKTRWPAFIGMNVIWSVALSLLLLMLWYCYKRGREERLLRETTEADGQRIEELPDDPMLPSSDRDTPAIQLRSEEASTSSLSRRSTHQETNRR